MFLIMSDSAYKAQRAAGIMSGIEQATHALHGGNQLNSLLKGTANKESQKATPLLSH